MLQSHQSHHALWPCCCVYRSKADRLPLINSHCSVPLFNPAFLQLWPLTRHSRVNNRPLGPSSLVTGPRSEGPAEAKSGEGVQRQRHRADAGACFGPLSPCPVCPFIQPGPILSLLITGLNVEQREFSLAWCLCFKAAWDIVILMLRQL